MKYLRNFKTYILRMISIMVTMTSCDAKVNNNTNISAGEINVNTDDKQDNGNDPGDFTAASNLVASPEIDGVLGFYDNDMKIYFSWSPAIDENVGIRDNTFHRYELADCKGLSIDTDSMRGNSLVFEGKNHVTYSFKVTSFNNAAQSNTSECSNSITIDLDPPDNLSFKIESDKRATKTKDVNLQIHADDLQDQEMYITNLPNCTSGGVWEKYSSMKQWTLAQSNQIATVFAKFRDRTGNESNCISDQILHDNVPPSNVNISINNDATYTNNASVNVTLVATNAEEVYLTNNPGCESGGVWQTYMSQTSWDLFDQNANAIVYAKFRDYAGNTSSCVSDSIIHDNIPPPNPSIVIDNGRVATGSNTVTLSNSAVAASEMYITNTSGCNSAGTWESYTPEKSWSLTSTPSIHSIYIKYRDLAGNESQCVSDSISYLKLYQARVNPAAVALGNKVLFAGGTSSDAYSDTVEIYDHVSGSWTWATLSVARSHIGAGGAGNQILFAGGRGSNGVTNTVDIYSTDTNSWSLQSLSQARAGAETASIGSKVWIAGGWLLNSSNLFVYSNTIDIYDTSNQSWSVETMPQAKSEFSSAVVGSKIIFAGGHTQTGPGDPETLSDTAAIFDTDTNSWQVLNMPRAASNQRSFSFGNKVYFIDTIASVIDVLDTSTNTWTTIPIPESKSGCAYAATSSKIFLGGGVQGIADLSKVNIFDISTNTWSIKYLSDPRRDLVGIGFMNFVIFAGGVSGFGESATYKSILDIMQ